MANPSPPISFFQVPDPTAIAPSDWDEDEDGECFHHPLHSSQQYATALVFNIGVGGFLLTKWFSSFCVNSSFILGACPHCDGPLWLGLTQGLGLGLRLPRPNPNLTLTLNPILF